MVLILSAEDDVSTTKVINWLDYLGEKWMRINGTDPIKISQISIGNSTKPEIIIENKNGEKINLSSIKAYWYRRVDFTFDIYTRLITLNEPGLKNQIVAHCNSELNYLRNALHAILNTIPSINDRRLADLNKYDVLLKAQLVNLKIPETLITSTKKDYLKFKQKHKSVISKAIQNGARFTIKDEMEDIVFLCYTELFNKEEEIPDSFFPTLFQNALDKLYEIRVFYLNKKCYSMVIFSQNTEGTKTDFRNYNLSKPNRKMRYALPKEIENKIEKLMDSLDLNCGSIDIIYTTKKEYVFLEVNPVGQFGMVSTPCNYALEKQIAKTLIYHD